MDEQTVEIYLVRHGETDSNVQGLLSGHSYESLNALGRQQAQAVAARLSEAGLNAIYSSDLPRARQTAQAVAEKTGLSVRQDARLREIHFGEWETRAAKEIMEEDEERLSAFFGDPYNIRAPGGESFRDQRLRAEAALNDIGSAHPGKRVAIVAHGGILLTLSHGIYGNETFVGREFDNGSITLIRGTPGAWEIVKLNDTEHLDEIEGEG